MYLSCMRSIANRRWDAKMRKSHVPRGQRANPDEHKRNATLVNLIVKIVKISISEEAVKVDTNSLPSDRFLLLYRANSNSVPR
jgi:hypothetical protein